MDTRHIALVLAAHGDRGSAERNAIVRGHAATLASRGKFKSVLIGVLNGEPSLAEALREADHGHLDRIVLYPFFMSAGYFVGTRLPEEIRRAAVRAKVEVMPPLGLDPGIPGVLLRRSLAAAKKAGFAPATTRLLIVGHGSKFGRASANATKAVANIANSEGAFKTVETAFLEERPFLDDALQSGKLPTVVAGFFSGEGMHGHDDVPQAIGRAAMACVYTRPIGGDPEVSSLIERAALAMQWPAQEFRSGGHISA